MLDQKDTEIKVKAGTLSVVLEDSASCLCWMQCGEGEDTYINLSLRFDQGHRVRLCGYPQEWAIWDTNVHQYDYESPLCKVLFEEFDYALEDFGYDIYVSLEDEVMALEAIKKDLKDQFKDKEFSKCLNIHQKITLIQRIDDTIEHLKKCA